MRCSLNLHLRSAHEKPKQPNRFDSLTDPDLPYNVVLLRRGKTYYEMKTCKEKTNNKNTPDCNVYLLLPQPLSKSKLKILNFLLKNLLGVLLNMSYN